METKVSDFEELCEILIEDYPQLDGNTRAFESFCDNFHFSFKDSDADWHERVMEFLDAYIGEFVTREDFIREHFDGSYDIPDWIVSHVDWDSVWDCEVSHEFWEDNDYYFRNI